jgi:hypothetical protein
VFCLEHDRIEDAGLRRDGARFARVPFVTEAQVASTQVLPTGFGSRPACLFSNLAIQFSSAARSSCSTPVALEEREISAVRMVGVRATKVILFAPKHSPPEQPA